MLIGSHTLGKSGDLIRHRVVHLHGDAVPAARSDHRRRLLDGLRTTHVGYLALLIVGSNVSADALFVPTSGRWPKRR